MTHTGTFIADLEAHVCRAELGPDPILLLASARTHLANRVMEEGDVQAWFLIGEKIDALFSESGEPA